MAYNYFDLIIHSYINQQICIDSVVYIRLWEIKKNEAETVHVLKQMIAILDTFADLSTNWIKCLLTYYKSNTIVSTMWNTQKNSKQMFATSHQMLSKFWRFWKFSKYPPKSQGNVSALYSLYWTSRVKINYEL